MRFLRGDVLAGVLLLAWGIVKLPLEMHIEAQQKEARFGGRIPLTQDIRDAVGQGAALGLLAGFRGFVANFLFIQAHEHWEKEEWQRMRGLLDVVCTLQPRNIKFWEMSAWHLAWNVSYAASVNPREPREAARIKAQRGWIAEGRKLLERGVQAVPDRWNLWFQLGWLINQKQNIPEESARYFMKASEFPDAPAYVARFAGYDLKKAGKLEEALAWWRGIWAQYPEKKDLKYYFWDKVEEQIRLLEEELDLPPSERTFPHPERVVPLPD